MSGFSFFLLLVRLSFALRQAQTCFVDLSATQLA